MLDPMSCFKLEEMIWLILLLSVLVQMVVHLEVHEELVFATVLFRHGHRNPNTPSIIADTLFLENLKVSFDENTAN